MPEGGGLVGGQGKDGAGRRLVLKGLSEEFFCHDPSVRGVQDRHGNLGREPGESIGVAFATVLGDPHAIAEVVFACGSNIQAIRRVRFQ